MKTALVVLLSVLLVGCATSMPETVQVPIPVPCKIQEPEQPQLKFSPPYDNVFDAVRDLLGDRVLMEAYQNELRIALSACR